MGHVRGGSSRRPGLDAARSLRAMAEDVAFAAASYGGVQGQAVLEVLGRLAFVEARVHVALLWVAPALLMMAFKGPRRAVTTQAVKIDPDVVPERYIVCAEVLERFGGAMALQAIAWIGIFGNSTGAVWPFVAALPLAYRTLQGAGASLAETPVGRPAPDVADLESRLEASMNLRKEEGPWGAVVLGMGDLKLYAFLVWRRAACFLLAAGTVARLPLLVLWLREYVDALTYPDFGLAGAHFLANDYYWNASTLWAVFAAPWRMVLLDALPFGSVPAWYFRHACTFLLLAWVIHRAYVLLTGDGLNDILRRLPVWKKGVGWQVAAARRSGAEAGEDKDGGGAEDAKVKDEDLPIGDRGRKNGDVFYMLDEDTRGAVRNPFRFLS